MEEVQRRHPPLEGDGVLEVDDVPGLPLPLRLLDVPRRQYLLRLVGDRRHCVVPGADRHRRLADARAPEGEAVHRAAPLQALLDEVVGPLPAELPPPGLPAVAARQGVDDDRPLVEPGRPVPLVLRQFQVYDL